MADFLLTLVGALIVGAIVFGLVAYAFKAEPGLSAPEPDGPPLYLPASRPLTATDLRALRFEMTVRGYRMSQVDDVLARAGRELDAAHARVRELERQLAHEKASHAQPAGHEEDDTPSEPVPDEAWRA